MIKGILPLLITSFSISTLLLPMDHRSIVEMPYDERLRYQQIQEEYINQSMRNDIHLGEAHQNKVENRISSIISSCHGPRTAISAILSQLTLAPAEIPGNSCLHQKGCIKTVMDTIYNKFASFSFEEIALYLNTAGSKEWLKDQLEFDNEPTMNELQALLNHYTKEGNLEIIKRILKATTSPCPHPLSSSLVKACLRDYVTDNEKRIEMVKLFLNKKYQFDVNVLECGKTALIAAAQHDFDQVVTILINHNADLNQKTKCLENTALIEAANNGSPRIVALLTKAGADISLKNKESNDALDEAKIEKAKVRECSAEWEHYEVVIDLLEEAKANHRPQPKTIK